MLSHHAVWMPFVALLAWAGVADIRSRRIPNLLNVLLFIGGVGASILGSAAPPAISSLGAFGLVLVVSVVLWQVGLCGGGDAKLAAAAATWVGLARLPTFALVTALAGGGLAILCCVLSTAGARRAIRANLFVAASLGPSAMTARSSSSGVSVPYGVAIAIGAAWAVLGVPT